MADRFPAGGSHLERYAARFSAVEINSTFYRPHRPQTFQRWATAVPEGFRFAVKAPKTVTHERRLTDCASLVQAFLDQVGLLGDRLGPILVQLPPSLAFESGVAETFFSDLRRRFSGPVACEPRHPSWFELAANGLLAAYQVARVAADPAPDPRAATPGGWTDFAYIRMHGSPRIYYSAYGTERLAVLARTLDRQSAETWIIFDNTALGAAVDDALALGEILAGDAT